MADNASYPGVPFRPNYIDIRSSQVNDERVTLSDESNLATDWARIYADGATLENGVTLKVRDKGTLIKYGAVSVTGLTADGGYQLDAGEEVFIPVRQLSNVWVKQGATTGESLGATPKITWKAS